jgi:DNA (cytosine-5)-methyltransferase 1
MNYYNEFDPKAAAWLRELIKANLIPNGEVDERSIRDVRPADLDGFTQCHFFAGIGGWSRALRLAGWPDERPCWTGSCPCQPFSCAGKGLGTADDRHLWPVFSELIRECKPAIVFGEQVASKAGRDWISGVFADLEGMAYRRAGADLCAASVRAPHIRQRLWWVAHSEHDGRRADEPRRRQERRATDGRDCETSRLADAEHERHGTERNSETGRRESQRASTSGGMGNADGQGLQKRECDGRIQPEAVGSPSRKTAISRSNSFWSSAIWHQCRDGKARRISPEPALFPLAHGLPGRVGLLRGAGNAIVPQVAQIFIQSVMDCID